MITRNDEINHLFQYKIQQHLIAILPNLFRKFGMECFDVVITFPAVPKEYASWSWKWNHLGEIAVDRLRARLNSIGEYNLRLEVMRQMNMSEHARFTWSKKRCHLAILFLLDDQRFTLTNRFVIAHELKKSAEIIAKRCAVSLLTAHGSMVEISAHKVFRKFILPDNDYCKIHAWQTAVKSLVKYHLIQALKNPRHPLMIESKKWAKNLKGIYSISRIA